MALQASLFHRYFFQPISFSYDVLRFGAYRSWLLHRSARLFHHQVYFRLLSKGH